MIVKITSEKMWQGITRSGTRDPLHDRLPNERVMEALSLQKLAYTGLAMRFIQSRGNTLVHIVPYHEDKPRIADGVPRAECGAHEMGWYAAINIRARDKPLDRTFIEKLGKAADVGIASRAGENGRLLITLGHVLAAGVYVYTISLVDTELMELAAGRAKVNLVARELLRSKANGVVPEERKLVNALTGL